VVKTIVKRDGRREDFNPDKINRWGIWSAKSLGNYVDWPSVVLQAVASLPEECTSEQLQEQLIRVCLDNNSWSYNRMAGRLYAALTYKQLYGNIIPTVKDLHNNLQKIGFMVNLDYSDDEYEQIEKIINHGQDFKSSYYELQHIRKKYALQNRVTGDEYESQQFVYMRMAMALAEKEPRETRLVDVKNWYEHFSQKRINAPTPNYVNLGTPLRGYASCMTYTTQDSAQSLAVGDHIAYIMTCMSAGVGSHINTRSMGDPVRKGLISHQGKLPYYRALDGAVHANLQSGRGGAVTVHYHAFDPEVEVIAQLKNPMSTEDKKIRGLDYSFGSNKFFAKKAAKNEDVFAFNSFNAPDLWDAFYSDDLELFEKLYLKYEKDKSFKKVWVNARDLLVTVLNEAYETGRAYLHFPDEMNKHTPFKDTIYSSNLCVSPETQILTDIGYVPIAEMENESVNVWNGSEWSEVTIRKTGEGQKLLHVSTTSGYELDCTPYHKFYVFNGYGKEYVEKRAFELKPGDKLCKFDLPVIEGSLTFDVPYVNGFFSGDGCTYRNTNIVYLYGEKRKLLPEINKATVTHHSVHEQQDREILYVSGLRPKFFVPTEAFTINTRLEWLAGWLDADGSVYRNGTNEALVGSSVEREFLKQIQLMLQTLGVSAKVTKMSDAGLKPLPKNDGSGEKGFYPCQDSYRLLISSYDSYRLLQLGLGDYLKRLNIQKRLPQRDAKQFVQIESVIDEGRIDDTYCFTEPKRHMGMFNGILTGQCQEIALPTSGYPNMPSLYSKEDHGEGEIGLCSLAGLCVDHIKDDLEYEDAMYYALKMIDKCIDLADYALPHLELTAKSRRSAGVGIIGLAHYMASKHLSYSTQEGRDEIHRVAERHMYYAIKASLRLAKEYGIAPWMYKTKWPDGWLPLDTYNKNVDNIVGVQLQYDWETLRKEIVENGGIRNSVLVAHMPSESSSMASGTTNGVYPVRSLTLIKGDANKVTYWAAPEGEKLSKWYDIAWDVKPLDLIQCYSIIQKWTDQGISADLYDDVSSKKVSASDMLKDYFAMVKYGLKSRYYMNTLTTKGVDLNDPSDEEYCESCTL